MKIEQEYRTPEGYYDQPYIYVADADALTDGLDYTNVPAFVPRDGSSFVLRQIYGRNNVCARMQLRHSYAPLTAAGRGIAMPNTWPVVPELVIQPEGGLIADVYTVARANRVNLAVTIFFAQAAFQGVRRWPTSTPGTTRYPGVSDYKYYEKPYTYETVVTVNWVGTDATPRRFNVPILDSDFELQRLTIMRQQQAGAASYAIPANEIKLTLYDAYPQALMSAPVLDTILNDAADATTHPYNGVFPVPGVLYRTGGAIRFDVVSLLTVNLLNSQYQICFHGMRRVPC